MLILVCRTGNRLEYLPGVCRISFYTYGPGMFVELVLILM